MSWSPHDLPFQRDIAVRVLHDAADFWERPESLQHAPDAADHSRSIREFAHLLHSAALSWLDSDVCALISDTMDDVPQWSPAATMPGQTGLIAFERPPLEVVWTGGADGAWRTVNVDALAWEVSGGRVNIRALSRLQGVRQHLSPLRHHMPFDDVVGATVDMDGPLGEGANVTSRRTDDYSGPAKAGHDLLALAGATWLLLSQPAVVEDGDTETVRVKRKATGQRPKQVVPVRVSVRKLTRRAGDAGGRGGGGRGVATTRWWVRGHWRQQAWGKGRALRKPVFIAPHTAGAADGEVDETPRVQVVRKD